MVTDQQNVLSFPSLGICLLRYLPNPSISQLLEMDIDNALEFFKQNPGRIEDKIVEKIQPLSDVGLGYLKLGQSSSTLSGGEAQRIKLASFLSKGTKANSTLFIYNVIRVNSRGPYSHRKESLARQKHH